MKSGTRSMTNGCGGPHEGLGIIAAAAAIPALDSTAPIDDPLEERLWQQLCTRFLGIEALDPAFRELPEVLLE